MPFMWSEKPLLNLTATTAPTVNDDVTLGYTADPVSFWYDTVGGSMYMCTDNTDGAAQWIDISGGAGSFTDMTVTGDGTIRTLITSPEQDQNITAAGNTIVSQNTHVHLTPDADYVMSSTPTIQAGSDGQWLILHNATNFTIDLQDDSILAGSGIFLGGAEGTLKPMGVMLLEYSGTVGGWAVVSNPNTSTAGANADTLQVRNQSGSGITAGSAVYISGFNAGQNRILVDLADANNAATMPCIGIVSTTIGNGANGEVISFGNAIGLINTATAAVNQGVWVSTTPGAVVFTRPAVDQIQRIGTVSRVNASGNIVVTGAGRTNDVPINFAGNDVTVQGSILTEANAVVDTNELDVDFLGNENDLDLGGGTYMRFINDTLGSVDLTGMVANGTNPHIWISCVGAQNVVLKHQDANSQAENRFLFSTGADITLTPNDNIHIIYDATTTRWRDFG